VVSQNTHFKGINVREYYSGPVTTGVPRSYGDVLNRDRVWQANSLDLKLCMWAWFTRLL